MIAKEKAEELLAKFEHEICFTDAKKCALIAVDEILIAIQDLPENNVRWDYWQEVKKEIEIKEGNK
jgi:hypothetical protein